MRRLGIYTAFIRLLIGPIKNHLKGNVQLKTFSCEKALLLRHSRPILAVFLFPFLPASRLLIFASLFHRPGSATQNFKIASDLSSAEILQSQF